MNNAQPSFQADYEKAYRGLMNKGMKIVIVDDKKETFHGDLDGDTVYLGKSQPYETKFFTLIHLSAHNYQWTISERCSEIGSTLYYQPEAGLFKELMDYEVEAAHLSITLMHELGIHHRDEWYSKYSHCDLKFLEYFYRTGANDKTVMDFWEEDVPNFEPLRLPKVDGFRKRVVLQKGVVIY